MFGTGWLGFGAGHLVFGTRRLGLGPSTRVRDRLTGIRDPSPSVRDRLAGARVQPLEFGTVYLGFGTGHLGLGLTDALDPAWAGKVVREVPHPHILPQSSSYCPGCWLRGNPQNLGHTHFVIEIWPSYIDHFDLTALLCLRINFWRPCSTAGAGCEADAGLF